MKSKRIKKNQKIVPIIPPPIIPPIPPIPAGMIPISDIQNPEVKAFLNDMIEQQLKEDARLHQKQKEKLGSLKYLEGMLSEYLNGFVVIGYTCNGDRFVINHANNTMQEDALIEQLKSIFIGLMESRLRR